MRNKKKLLIRQLDRKLERFRELENIHVPERGWINSIRTTLNMSLEQLGRRLNNMSKQGIREIEAREASGSITINSLKKAGNALDLKLVYGFVPNFSTLEILVDLRAREVATKIVSRTNNIMILEMQGINEEMINEAIDELAYEIKREMRKSLWD